MTTTPMTGDKFVDLIRKSGLVADGSLNEYAKQSSLAGNPTSLATALVRAGLLTQFQAKLLLAGKYRGLILGQYKLLDQLGKGGMGTVYLAEHMSLKRKAAVKVLAYEQAGTAIGTERFYREAQSAAALDHPNIVKVYDVGQLGNVHYIAMEYIEGQTLAAMVEKNGPLHFAAAADYIAQASAGLQEAGDKGFVHRDIKPENLIVDKSGTLKILDMGLTRPSEESTERLTAVIDPESVVGTPDYIAPEQALNQPVDIRTDIYSLGVTFFALLTGKPPFSGSTAQKLLQHQLKDAPSLTSLRAKAPPEIGPIIATMMAKKPSDRYQQPQDVIEALAPWLSPETAGQTGTKTVTAALTRVTSRSRILSAPTPSKPKWLIPGIIAATVVIAVLGGAAAFLIPTGTATTESTTQSDTQPGDRPGTSATTAKPVPAPVAPAFGTVPEGAVVVGPEGPEPRFGTIAEAIAAMKPTDKKLIVLRTAQHAEQLNLTGPKFNNIVIESGLSRGSVIWTLPAGGSIDKPLLELNAVDGVKIKGIRFEGQGKVGDLVRISGRCPGLSLEEIAGVGFQRTAISLFGATGAENRPMTLRRIRTFGGGDQAAGIQLEGGQAHGFLKIVDSRFEGPSGTGIAIAGAATNLEVRRSRFWRLKQGIHYKPSGLPGPLTAQFRQNTFASTATGIEFAAIPQNPAEEPTDALAIVDNLFVDCAHLAMLTGTPLMPDNPPVWVWYPEFDKNTNIPAQFRYFRREFTLPVKPTAPMILNLGVDESFALFVNGEEIGKSSGPFFSQRVYRYDLTAKLKAGANVIAVAAKNELDPFNSGYASAAAITARFVQLDGDKEKELFVADESWKSAKNRPAEEWTKPGFDDKDWLPAKPWALSGVNYPWRETVWDSIVEAHLKSRGKLLKPLVTGNVRDYFSMEGYPLLESKRTAMKIKDEAILGLDPEDDDKFLRYGSGSSLGSGGSDKGPVGMPPAGQ